MKIGENQRNITRISIQFSNQYYLAHHYFKSSCSRLSSFLKLKQLEITNLPFTILMATFDAADLNGRFLAVPLATWPKAPLRMIFSTFTSLRSTSHERVFRSSGTYSTLETGLTGLLDPSLVGQMPCKRHIGELIGDLLL